MDTEKSSSSSFEDLSNINELETKSAHVKESDVKGEAKDSFQIGTKNAKNQQENIKLEGSGVGVSIGDNEPCDVLGNGQLVKRVIKQSQLIARPARGDLVTVTFNGRMPNGIVVEKKENYQIHVGDYEVSGFILLYTFYNNILMFRLYKDSTWLFL